MHAYQKNVDYPLTEAQTQRLTSEMLREMRRNLTARRFIDVFGPLGAGLETVSYETYGEDAMAEVDLVGGRDARVIAAESEVYRRIPLIYKDFVFHWRDVELSRKMDAPLDVSRAVRAAHFVAHREEELIYKGNKDLGIEGLLNSKQRLQTKRLDWKQFGKPYQNIREATVTLLKANHHRPYACILSPQLYAELLKTDKDLPVIEIDAIAKLCEDGVYQSQALAPDQALVVSTGPQNFDLAIAEDVSVAYLGPENMNYSFRIYESLVLRIKRPTAICTLDLE
ncbi:MAG: bacteriocin family protein [Deltaproteobacteria bacterium]|nr:bacteriocin family protein [Deltaproteobacteria bacterium]